MKKLVKEKSNTMELYERYQNCQDPIIIKKFTVELRLEYYFKEKTDEVRKEIKKILPKDKSILKNGTFHEIKFDSRNKEVYYSAYTKA